MICVNCQLSMQVPNVRTCPLAKACLIRVRFCGLALTPGMDLGREQAIRDRREPVLGIQIPREKISIVGKIREGRRPVLGKETIGIRYVGPSDPGRN